MPTPTGLPRVGESVRYYTPTTMDHPYYGEVLERSGGALWQVRVHWRNKPQHAKNPRWLIDAHHYFAKGWLTIVDPTSEKATQMPIPTPEKATQMLMFVPADVDANDHSISSAPLAFDVSVMNDRFFVDSMRINGECVENKEFGIFPDALEECAKRMRTQSHIKYIIE